MRIMDLVEGVKVGSKNKASAISRTDVGVGIEYEFRGFFKYSDSNQIRKMSVDDVKGILDKNNIDYDKVEKEHDFQVEVVTDVMSLSDGLKHLQKMFTLLSTNDDSMYFEVDDNSSGLHISISLKDAKERFNPLKFLLLMNTDYIGTLFPEREYTTNNNEILEKLPTVYRINKYDIGNDPSEIYRFEKDLISDISGNNDENVTPDTLKYTAIKLSDYAMYNGRIELRFFGGKDYMNYNLIKDQVARSLYLLDIAHGNKFDKEYKKLLFKLYSDLLGNKNDIDLIAALESKEINASTLRALKSEWERINIDSLPDQSMSILHYLKLLDFVKKYLPKSYAKYNSNIKEVISNVRNLRTPVIRLILTSSPLLLNDFIDTIINNKLHKVLRLQDFNEKLSSSLSLEIWSKILNISNINSIKLSDISDPHNPTSDEIDLITKIVNFNKKVDNPNTNKFVNEYGELLKRTIKGYEDFNNLETFKQTVINGAFPGYMEELMLKELGM